MSKFLNPVCGGHTDNFFESELCEYCKKYQIERQRRYSALVKVISLYNQILEINPGDYRTIRFKKAVIVTFKATEAFAFLNFTFSPCTCSPELKEQRERETHFVYYSKVFPIKSRS